MLFILFTCCARKSLSNFNALSGSENYGAVKYGESFIFIARVVKGYVYAIVSQVQGCEGLRFLTDDANSFCKKVYEAKDFNISLQSILHV